MPDKVTKTVFLQYLSCNSISWYLDVKGLTLNKGAKPVWPVLTYALLFLQIPTWYIVMDAMYPHVCSNR